MGKGMLKTNSTTNGVDKPTTCHYKKLYFFQQVFIDGHLKPLIIALIIDNWNHPSIKSVDKITRARAGDFPS